MGEANTRRSFGRQAKGVFEDTDELIIEMTKKTEMIDEDKKEVNVGIGPLWFICIMANLASLKKSSGNDNLPCDLPHLSLGVPLLFILTLLSTFNPHASHPPPSDLPSICVLKMH